MYYFSKAVFVARFKHLRKCSNSLFTVDYIRGKQEIKLIVHLSQKLSIQYNDESGFPISFQCLKLKIGKRINRRPPIESRVLDKSLLLYYWGVLTLLFAKLHPALEFFSQSLQMYKDNGKLLVSAIFLIRST